MVDKIDGATIVIGGDSRPAEAAINRVADAMEGLGETAQSVAGLLGAAFGIEQLVQLINTSGKAIVEFSKLSGELGVTVEGLQAVTRAADLGGVALDGVNATIRTVAASIAELQKGKEGDIADAFEKLGISAEDLKGLDIDKEFGVIADAVKNTTLSTKDLSETLQTLGIDQAEMITTLRKGSDAFNQARDDVERFGVAVSDIDAAKVAVSAEAFQKWQKDISASVSAVGNQLVTDLAPIITATTKTFSDMGITSKSVANGLEIIVYSTIGAFGILKDVVIAVGNVLEKLWDTAAKAIATVGAAVSATDRFFRGMLQSTLDVTGGVKATGDAIGNMVDPAKAVQNQMAGVALAINNAVGGEYPSEALSRWAQKARESSDVAAQAMIDSATKQRLAAASATDAVIEEEDKKAIAQQRTADAHLQSLLKTLQTAEDFETGSYQRRMEQLIAFNDQGLITQQQYDDLVERNNQVHFEKMNQAQAAAFTQSQALYTGLANQVGALLGNITTAIGSEGKKQFALSKAIALASAIVKGYESIVSAYAAGSRIGGPPIGALYAGIAAAATAVQIAGLRSTNETSTGGGGGSIASSGSEAAAAPQSLRVEGIDPGSLFTGDVVRTFANTLLQFQADGGKVVLA